MSFGGETYGTCQNRMEKLKLLQNLELSWCTSLMALPDSIGNLSVLVKLNLFGCINLQNLPNEIGNLKLLQMLDLSYCKSLKTTRFYGWFMSFGGTSLTSVWKPTQLARNNWKFETSSKVGFMWLQEFEDCQILLVTY